LRKVSTKFSFCYHNNLELEIIHFNDVYNLEERPNDHIKAGAARFITALDKYDSKNKLVVFSGDLFSPSNCKHISLIS
jgi:5'-nucleotidase